MKEKIQLVYKPVDLVLAKDGPTFIGTEMKLKFNPPLIYQVGSMVEAPDDQTMAGFSSLKTALVYESVGYYGVVPYSGFVAVGETTSDYRIKPFKVFSADQYVEFKRMRVTGIKAFVEESEVGQGHVREFISPYGLESQLIMDRNGIAKGKARFAFRITQDGRVIFKNSEVVYRTVKVEPEELNYQQIIEAISRGEVVKIGKPRFDLYHSMTKPNEKGGHVSLEKLTKEQIMDMYQEMEESRRRLEGCQ